MPLQQQLPNPKIIRNIKATDECVKGWISRGRCGTDYNTSLSRYEEAAGSEMYGNEFSSADMLIFLILILIQNF